MFADIPLRILHITTKSHPFLDDLVLAHRERGLDVRICLLGTPDTESAPFYSFAVTDKEQVLTQFHDLLLSFRPHILHYSFFSSLPILELLKIAKSLGIQVVYTPSEYLSMCHRGTLYRNDRSLCTDYNLSSCISCARTDSLSLHSAKLEERKEYYQEMHSLVDHTIVPSLYYIFLLRQFFPYLTIGPYTLLPHQVNEALFTVDTTWKRNNYSPFVIGYCGMFEDHKGAHLLSALVELFREQDDVQFLFAIKERPGSSGVPLPSSPFLKIKKNISRAQLSSEFYNKIHLLLIPSLWMETGPLTLEEGLLHACPTLVSHHLRVKKREHPLLGYFERDNLFSLQSQIDWVRTHYDQLISRRESRQALYDDYAITVEHIYYTLIEQESVQ